MQRDTAGFDEAAWVNSGEVHTLDDGFQLEPVATDRDGRAISGMGWDIIAPNGQRFAWAFTLAEVSEKIEQEKKERLWH